MKYKNSKYNFTVNYLDRIIFFNALTNSIFSLSKAEYTNLKEKYLDDLNSFQFEMPNLFNIFKDNGFIVDNEVEEVNIIKFRNIRDVYLDNYYKIIVNPTLQCNFNCWYCYQDRKKGYMDNITADLIYKHTEYLIDTKQVSGINLGWFGGEPLLLFDKIIYPLSLKIKNKLENKNLYFLNSATTNGYLLKPKLINKLKDIDLINFQITLDGNKQQHDNSRNFRGKPSFDIIIENINSVLENIENSQIILRINYTDKTFEGLDCIFDFFSKENRNRVFIDLQRIWQTYEEEGNPINKKMINFALLAVKNGFNLADTFISTNRGCTCYADRFNFAHINYDGKIYKCTARNYEEKDVMGVFDENGSILWNTNKLSKTLCTSSFDNNECLYCKYLPICLGPCSQKRLENHKTESYCFKNDYEENMNELIIMKYLLFRQEQINNYKI